MIDVTEDAKDLLDNIIGEALSKVESSNAERSDVGLRLAVQDHALAIGIDVPREGDEVVEKDGNPVLLLDPQAGTLLDGATVGTEDTPEGRKLTISR